MHQSFHISNTIQGTPLLLCLVEGLAISLYKSGIDSISTFAELNPYFNDLLVYNYIKM